MNYYIIIVKLVKYLEGCLLSDEGKSVSIICNMSHGLVEGGHMGLGCISDIVGACCWRNTRRR